MPLTRYANKRLLDEHERQEHNEKVQRDVPLRDGGCMGRVPRPTGGQVAKGAAGGRYDKGGNQHS